MPCAETVQDTLSHRVRLRKHRNAALVVSVNFQGKSSAVRTGNGEPKVENHRIIYVGKITEPNN